MSASTEMTRLDSLPKETLDALMELVEIGAAEKLNNMEGGIKNGQPFIVTITTQDEETYASDKTYAEVEAAIDNGLSVIFRLMYSNGDFCDITNIFRGPSNISGPYLDVGSFASGNLELIYTCVELNERGTVNVIDTTYLIGNVSEG